MLERRLFLERFLPSDLSRAHASTATLAVERKWPHSFVPQSCCLQRSFFSLGCTIFPNVFLLLCECLEWVYGDAEVLT